MKSICTLLTVLLTFGIARSQAVLNEIYAYPGAAEHEFFELYNNTPGNTPASVDDYTLITYFEEGGTAGFYVMNLPNVTMAPGGYLVGASRMPFNYQGNIGSNAADFNWNELNTAGTYGYLKKMVWNKAKKEYEEVATPANFNDFFSHLNGAGASYSTFLFQEDRLMNVFLGGTGGTKSIPKFITAMAPLPVEVLTESNTHEIVIDFKDYADNRTEYVIQDIGTDNGYMRESDGMCGEWEKSSSQAFHTPGQTNGGNPMAITGSFTVQTHIYRAPTDEEQSFIVYDITAGPDYLMPAQVFIYKDNGTLAGQWDPGDENIDYKDVAAVADPAMTTYFSPKDVDLILVIKTSLGCLDQVRLLINEEIEPITLPVRLLAFNGTVDNKGNKAALSWAVTENEWAQYYEVEKSSDGHSFTSAGIIEGSNKTGYGYYSYNDVLTSQSATHYRLKIVSKDKAVTYSKVIVLKNGAQATATLQLLQNPVKDRLVCLYTATAGAPTTLSIYNTAGVKLYSKTVTTQKGLNTLLIDLDGRVSSGTYILEVLTNTERSTAKFLRF